MLFRSRTGDGYVDLDTAIMRSNDTYFYDAYPLQQPLLVFASRPQVRCVAVIQTIGLKVRRITAQGVTGLLKQQAEQLPAIVDQAVRYRSRPCSRSK